MDYVRRAGWLAATWFALATLSSSGRLSHAQAIFGLSSRFELSDTVQLDEIDSATKTHLERVKAFVANNEWDEAVETLRQISENHGGKIVGVTARRYVSVRDFCHLQITRMLPAEALELYRSRVDPQARKWYEEGIATRNPEPLLNVVEQLFASSWGDDALYALGELAFEEGDYGGARGYWEKILPPDYWAKVTPAAAQAEGTPEWLVYPDTNLELADVRARLVLVPIWEGDLELARESLARFAQEFGNAEGRLGGRRVNYVEMLSDLVEQSPGWPREQATPDWPTFGGSPTRSKVLPEPGEVGAPLWRQQLPKTPSADFGYPPRRVAEAKNELLSYHPLVVGHLVLVNNEHEIRAYDVNTGGPAWSDDAVIFHDDLGREEPRRSPRNSLGVPRFTMTAANDKLYARMGNPNTNSPNMQFGAGTSGYLVCLDLAAEGKVLWDVGRTAPLEESWAFEGSPLTDGTHVYAAMRHSDVRPQAHVACFDAETGRVRWRQFICGAETPAQGQYEEITHNLLTLHRGMLYYNTNLGAVAALSARDGQVKWITLYPRARSGDLNQRAKHFYRDLTPCIYERGMLVVAPADSRHIFALDAATGLVVWQTDLPEDAVHLLGVGGGNLLASGDKLWWIHLASGKVAPVESPHGAWPDGPTPKGFGRGVLAGSEVYWPTRTTIYVFDQRSGRKQKEIELSTRGATGGNLLVARGYLIIATSDELLAFSPHTGVRDDAIPTTSQARPPGAARYASR